MEKELDIVFLLDKSGSMHGCEEDTIGGYNKYLEDNKNANAKITTVLFSDDYTLITFRKNIEYVENMNNKKYQTGGCTALYDAIGKTIKKLDKEDMDNKVLFIITTDGLENASSDYTKQDIIKLIKSHKNYEFIYLGANIDSYAEGAKLGINKRNIANFSKERIGNVFKKLGDMLYTEELDESWKDDLE